MLSLNFSRGYNPEKYLPYAYIIARYIIQVFFNSKECQVGFECGVNYLVLNQNTEIGPEIFPYSRSIPSHTRDNSQNSTRRVGLHPLAFICTTNMKIQTFITSRYKDICLSTHHDDIGEPSQRRMSSQEVRHSIGHL